jgi:hypothetical protein
MPVTTERLRRLAWFFGIAAASAAATALVAYGLRALLETG